MRPAVLGLLPFALQGLAMAADEFGFHRRRTVPWWEWLGHVLDTLVFLGCLALPLLLDLSPGHLRLFGFAAAGSCLLITKDEWVHRRLCTGGEQWLHAVLFLLHPLVLLATAWLWLASGGALPGPAPGLARALLVLQALAVAGFLGFQVVLGAGRRSEAPAVDNSVYDGLGERWYTATDDPVALLRAEARLLTPWISEELRGLGGPLAILDLACGAGLLANPLAALGHAVTGIDLSLSSLEVARRHDPTGTAAYLPMDARRLDFPDGRFDVVCMMDFLEHIEARDEVLREAARVLRPGGWFFFNTFNRTPAAGLFAIKGVALFVRNTPPHMHVYHLFLKPAELEALCARHGLAMEKMLGVRPRVLTRAFLDLLLKGTVSDAFAFEFTRSRRIGYCGRARKL